MDVQKKGALWSFLSYYLMKTQKQRREEIEWRMERPDQTERLNLRHVERGMKVDKPASGTVMRVEWTSGISTSPAAKQVGLS